MNNEELIKKLDAIREQAMEGLLIEGDSTMKWYDVGCAIGMLMFELGYRPQWNEEQQEIYHKFCELIHDK